ncbi:testis-expressed protein 10 homolog [Phalaenopsis equestris]|uniref:testis-expressed protein 10 homolog n=1 Tax=Phalaenopsis equestris TaxID=78828 RepID=UPI0009E262BD|nr:testis-expressed protein 10 homolog [Phalaenopsis equestris]XP_020590600.1 testis-expressed protein 10 homolog [Phalaenopsis equestris]XP_020590601.1 testis-expressed protein 10 homolog [Phalaenopsis equestris]
MGKTKPRVSKKPKRGLDFKKIKRKIGRKLPPPKNFTDTSIKSKAIILPEQSVATDKASLAVNNKGLTLRELLQQTSHHNAKIRRAALIGIKDLVSKHPSELKLHKLALIEKLRDRVCDKDKMVRETLYQILKTVIFPSLKEDATGPSISLLMVYVFSAMTHIAVDIRLMAFKLFKLVVLNYPSSFTIYTGQVIDNYIDILRNHLKYLQEKSNLRNALGGLVHCLSLLVSKSEEDDLNGQNINEKMCLHSYKSEARCDDAVLLAVKRFQDLVPALVSCFQESSSVIRSMSTIDTESFDCFLFMLQCINLSVTLYVKNINKFLVMPAHSTSLPDGGPYDMLVLLKKLWEIFPIVKMHRSTPKDDERYLLLNLKITETFLHLFPWINDSPFPIEKFLGFIESSLLGEVVCSSSCNKALLEKHLCPILPFIPSLISQATSSWRSSLLKAFTVAFKDCKVDSQICLLYLGAIKEMLLPTTSCSLQFCNYPELVGFQVDWLHELPSVLCRVGDRHANISKAILNLILSIGQSSVPNSFLAVEYDRLQSVLTGFYGRSIDDAKMHGPFIKLPIDCQELAISCLYYFSSVSIDLLESLALCCLDPTLDIVVVVRIAEVLNSAYRAGHVYISHFIGFLFTLVARFKANPNWFCIELKDGNFSSRGSFKFLVDYVSSCLSLMGDNSLVLKLLYKNFFNEISQKPSLDNTHGMLNMIITLDKNTCILSDESVITLSKCLAGYITDAASYIPEEIKADFQSDKFRIFKYYVRPCIILFYRNDKLLFHVLELFASALTENNFSVQSLSDFNFWLELSCKIHAVSSILILMHNEERCRGSLSLSKDVIKDVVQNIGNLRVTTTFSMTYEEKHKLQIIYDRLNAKF